MAKIKSLSKQSGVETKPVSSNDSAQVLPVTLLSGFLGSRKTTLLKHILSSDHGLRIAIIVNDIGAINVDASLIKNHLVTKAEDRVIALQNGCICCTLRGGLLEELMRLAELHAFDYIVIESSGISEPEQVAESFDFRLAEKMNLIAAESDILDERNKEVISRLLNAGGIEKFARLDTTVTVIDAFTIFNDFHTDQMLSARRNDVEKEDERTVSDLMVDQIEFADVIVVNKLDMVSEDAKSRVIDLIRKLNHRAKILETKYGKVNVKSIVNTGLFNLERAQTEYGWLEDLHEMTVQEVNNRKVISPQSEAEEYKVRNFVYTNKRPFHPLRLFRLLHDKFIMQLEHPDDEESDDEMIEDGEDDKENDDIDMCDVVDSDDEDVFQNDDDSFETDITIPSNEIILETKTSHPLFGRLFRSKGEFFLATRPSRAGEWSQAGAMLTLTGGRPWFCTLPEEEYLTGNLEIDQLVMHDVSAGEWGDRRQELVFIGESLDIEGLKAVLDECILNNDEFEAWTSIMRDNDLNQEKKEEKLANIFDDGFPDWPGDEGHEGHEGHDHSHGFHKHNH